MILDWIQGLIKPSIKTLRAPDLLDFKRKHTDAIFIDIREEVEAREEGLFPGAVRSIWKTAAFEETLRRFPKSRPIVVLCQTGKRSQMAAEKMTEAGFSKVYVAEGGLSAWLSTKKRMNSATASV